MNKTLNDRIQEFSDSVGKYVSSEFMEWLKEKGFFTAPASTKYHGNYEGGLFDHSMVVVDALVQLTRDNHLKWTDSRSPYVIGMFHDLCKIDAYKKVIDKEGVEMFGSDEAVGEEYHFEYNNNTFLPGHGEKSIIILQKFMQLTEEEILCIRWHMGAFDEKDNWNYFTRSIHQYSNVLWTHQADMIAAHVVGV